MRHRSFHLSFPWITLYITILIPLFTYSYAYLPASLRGGLLLWLTSPFNAFYEAGTVNAFFLNYAFVVLVFLFVELYTRNIADLKGRDSLIRNAFLLSVLSSYAVSAVMWLLLGFPSSGTSVIAFSVLIFCAFETYDSELIMRMSEKRQSLRRALKFISLVFLILVTILSAIYFVYLHQNSYWYVHIAGGLLFAAMYVVYLLRWVRPRIDVIEEKLEKEVETDLEKTGIEIEEETEKLEKGIEKGIKPRVGRPRRRRR